MRSLPVDVEPPHFGQPRPYGDHRLKQPELSVQEAMDHHVLVRPRPVRISVQPLCALSSKPIAPGQSGTITVAILGAADLDVTQVNQSSLNLQGIKPVTVNVADLNGDGFLDLLASFDAAQLKLHPRATKLKFSGWVKNSQVIFGEDAVTVVSTTAGQPFGCQQ